MPCRRRKRPHTRIARILKKNDSKKIEKEEILSFFFFLYMFLVGMMNISESCLGSHTHMQASTMFE